jgi:hypothetical protein
LRERRPGGGRRACNLATADQELVGLAVVHLVCLLQQAHQAHIVRVAVGPSFALRLPQAVHALLAATEVEGLAGQARALLLGRRPHARGLPLAGGGASTQRVRAHVAVTGSSVRVGLVHGGWAALDGHIQCLGGANRGGGGWEGRFGRGRSGCGWRLGRRRRGGGWRRGRRRGPHGRGGRRRGRRRRPHGRGGRRRGRRRGPWGR